MKSGRNIFVFDFNKCVACNACELACKFENKLDPDVNWRSVQSGNGSNHPDLPLHHLSLACNHCETAVCLINCPANAYSRDEKTGSVLIHEEKCIGCKYCIWICPYNAPKFNNKIGVIQKCTHCIHKSESAGEYRPACVVACPTGALDFENRTGVSAIENDPQYFADFGLNPGIQIIPIREKSYIPEEIKQSLRSKIPTPDIRISSSSVSLRKDWSLAVFSFLSTVLFTFFVADLFDVLLLNKTIFLLGICLAALASLQHLGKKQRALRSLLNIKNSWLSREVFSFGGFAVFSLIFSYSEFYFSGLLALTFGLGLLVSMDMVYQVIPHSKRRFNSAHTILTGVFLSAFLLELNVIWILLGVLKLVLYIGDRYRSWGRQSWVEKVFSSARVDLMLTIPLILWWISPPNLEMWILLCLIAGEAIDRSEFYNNLNVK